MPYSKNFSSSTNPCYFDSLQQLLLNNSSNIQQDRHHLNHQHHSSETSHYANTPSFMLIHDFKGGYYESNHSFEWLGLVDTFVYFSHHRVTIPPVQWITAANTHHTHILGTLIFEWDASDEILLLIKGPSSTQLQPPSSSLPGLPQRHDPPNFYINLKQPFDSISTYFADRLIDLAIHHQFHGWLVNVEVDLRKSLPNQAVCIVRALKVWLEYFRLQGHKRIGPDWQVCWYDSISYFDGSLAWQSQLHPLHNLSFFSSSSSIFLDYHWSPQHISASEAVVKQLANHLDHNSSINQHHEPSSVVNQHQEQDLKRLDLNWSSSLARRLLTTSPSEKEIKQSIFFGVDVFGRGTPYGGGFSSWRAAREILSAGFSVALFAPGWTWESESLGPDRADWKEGEPQWWSRWWRDERYFWAGLLEKTVSGVNKCEQLVSVEPPNAYSDSLRIAMEAKKPIPRRGLGSSELSEHRPFLDLFPVRHNHISESFHTNWSLGAGHGFWVHGRHHFDPLDGIADWSDMSMSFPIHDLSVGGGKICSVSDQRCVETSLARCDLVQHIGWFGSGSVEIEEQANKNDPQGTVKYLWMNTTSVKFKNEMNCRLVWRPIDPKDDGLTSPLGIVFQTNESLGQDDHEHEPKISITNHSDPSVKLSVINISLSPSSSLSTADLKISKIQTRQLDCGWFQSTCRLQTNQVCSKVITRIGITISSQSTFYHHLGEFSLAPMVPSNSQIGQLEQLEGLVERPLTVTWEPDQTRSESDRSTVTDVRHINDTLSGKIRWKINSFDQRQSVLLWLIYLENSNSKSCPSEKERSHKLVAVVKDTQEIHLSLPFLSPSKFHLSSQSLSLGSLASVFVTGIHIDYLIEFHGSCQLFSH